MSSIFRQSSIDRVSSPEQLHDYIKVSNPSVWVTLFAAIALLGALFIWGIFGDVPTVVKTNAVMQNGELVGILPLGAMNNEIVPGAKVIVNGKIKGTIKSISKEPVSKDDITAEYGAYISGNLVLGDWNVEILLDAPNSYTEGSIYPLSIVIEEINPINFLTN